MSAEIDPPLKCLSGSNINFNYHIGYAQIILDISPNQTIFEFLWNLSINYLMKVTLTCRANRYTLFYVERYFFKKSNVIDLIS
jgi:hypothetical protein